MNKTKQAMDELFASIITLIPSWLGMLKSTRTLTFIGTAIAIYYTAVHSGLAGNEAMVVAVVEAITGVSLITAKTIRTGAPRNGQNNQVIVASTISKITCPGCAKWVDDRVWCSDCGAVLHLPNMKPPQPRYSAPPNLDELGSQAANPMLKWIAIDSSLDWDLTPYHPDIRLDYARELLKKDREAIDIAWLEELAVTKALTNLPLPKAEDFTSYEAAETYKKRIMDGTPGCSWLSITQDTLLRGYKRYFAGRDWIEKLGDKTINWILAHSINEIAMLQYGAIL